MSARWTSALCALVLVVISPAASYADAGLLRTVHALDEARGYCLDVAGPPENLHLDDPLQAHTSLFSELVQKHHVRPRFRHSLGHNHVSQLLSVGTVDTSISREILDFIDRVTTR